MNSSVNACLAAFFCGALGVNAASAQVISQPTPQPLVTADSERWYLNGDPITYAGNTYYHAGAQVSFNPSEMVRSGFFLGVPLYIRTTDEPYSVVYVPLARGFMQPYMRLRAGDVAGTAGTAVASGAAAFSRRDGAVSPSQAAGPPTLVAGAPSDPLGQPRGAIPAVAPTEPPMVAGTSGVVPAPAPAIDAARRAAVHPTRTRIGSRPQGINAVFVEFRDRRWYGEGQPVVLDRARMIEIGDLRGFPVFVDRDEPEKRIYIAAAIGGSMVAPYSERKPR